MYTPNVIANFIFQNTYTCVAISTGILGSYVVKWLYDYRKTSTPIVPPAISKELLISNITKPRAPSLSSKNIYTLSENSNGWVSKELNPEEFEAQVSKEELYDCLKKFRFRSSQENEIAMRNLNNSSSIVCAVVEGKLSGFGYQIADWGLGAIFHICVKDFEKDDDTDFRIRKKIESLNPHYQCLNSSGVDGEMYFTITSGSELYSSSSS